MKVLLNKVRSSANLLLWTLTAVVSSTLAQDPFDFDLSETSAQPPWNISGYLESRNQYFVVGNDWASNRAAGFLELKWSGDQNEDSQWRAYGSTLIEYDEQTHDYRDPERAELKELYFIRDSTSFDFTIGKQRVPWGTADGVSTIDRVNAVDYRDPIGNARTASRRPSWVVRNEFNLSGGLLELVWLPRGRDRKLPEFGSPWEPDYLHELRTQRNSGLINLRIDDPHKDEGGLRYRVYGEGFDWSLAYFNGYTDGPVRQTVIANDVLLEHVRYETFNISGALGLSESTWRAEFAYTPNNIMSGVVTDLWQVVIGWERTFITDFKTSIQIFYDEAPDGPTNYGTTFSFSNSAFDDAAIYGVRGQLGSDEQLSAETYFDYEFGDNLTLTMKYMVFDGAEGSDNYDYRDNDFFETTLRWDF